LITACKKRGLSVCLIPEDWVRNLKRGRCICGKFKEEFEPKRRKYCSKICAEKYRQCWTSWSKVRDEFIHEHGYYCDGCGKKTPPAYYTTGLYEVDHIIAICNGGDEMDKENLQMLCSECHKEKTKLDMIENKKIRKNQTDFSKMNFI